MTVLFLPLSLATYRRKNWGEEGIWKECLSCPPFSYSVSIFNFSFFVFTFYLPVPLKFSLEQAMPVPYNNFSLEQTPLIHSFGHLFFGHLNLFETTRFRIYYRLIFATFGTGGKISLN